MLSSGMSYLLGRGSCRNCVVKARIDGADKELSCHSYVSGIRQGGEDVMAESGISTTGRDRGGVCVEVEVGFRQKKVIGHFLNMGDGGIWEAFLDFFGGWDGGSHDVGGDWE